MTRNGQPTIRTLASTAPEPFPNAREDPTLILLPVEGFEQHGKEGSICLYSSLYQARNYILFDMIQNNNPKGVNGRANPTKVHHNAHLYIHGIVRTGVLFYQARQALTPLLLKLPSAASHTVMIHVVLSANAFL